MDTGKGAGSALLHKMKGMVGAGGSGVPTLPIVELKTKLRTYVLAPATIIMPLPMSTSASLGRAASGKPLYLFGWPFPVPPLDPTDDEEDVAMAVSEGRVDMDAFAKWRDVLATAVAAEKATKQYPVSE